MSRRTVPRTAARRGTKSLACPSCAGSKGQVVVHFRGKSRARLDQHMTDTHGKRA